MKPLTGWSHLLGKVIDRIAAALAVVAGILLLFVTFSISYAILARFIGLRAPVWVVQFNEYALLWMTFLGATWVLARDKHVSIDLLTRGLGPGGRKLAGIVHSLMGIGVCGILFWYSAAVTWGQLRRGVVDVQAVDVPKGLVLSISPLGFLLLGLQFLRSFFVRLRGPGQDSGARPGDTLRLDPVLAEPDDQQAQG